eukprot:gene18737-24502_t
MNSFPYVLTVVLWFIQLSVSKRTVIITGANRGIGLETTRILASTNEWNIIAACRCVEATSKAFQSIKSGTDNINIYELDLNDLKSVKTFVNNIKASKLPIDVLACNAGVQFSGSGDTPLRTVQGFEKTIGINHIGHFYLANELISVLEKSNNNPRIVFVGSGVHNPEEKGGNVGSKATLGDLKGLELGFKDSVAMIDNGDYDGDKAYKDSKLCNVITALELSRRLSSKKSKVTSNVMNPGLIPTTGLFRDLNPIFVFIFTILTRYVFKVAVSEEIGGKRLAFMISDPSLDGITGAYYSGSSYCCEVPVTITGTFLADTSGTWDTEPDFFYARSAYSMTVAGLSYTNDQYKTVLTSISKKLRRIGSKAVNRDYAWNVIALSSYAANDLTRGSLKFYSTADAGIIFDKQIYGANIASSDVSCNLLYTAAYTASSAQLSLSFDLNFSYTNAHDKVVYNCPYTANDGCYNPCSSAMALNSFGYDPNKNSPTLDFTIDMGSVTTAVAVNYGLIDLSDLIEVPGDNARKDLFNRMNFSAIPILNNNATFNISSYYDVLYAPTAPIYCVTFTNISISQCLLRFGNTLVYPVVTSWGYYPSPKAKVQQCNAANVKSPAGRRLDSEFENDIENNIEIFNEMDLTLEELDILSNSSYGSGSSYGSNSGSNYGSSSSNASSSTTYSYGSDSSTSYTYSSSSTDDFVPYQKTCYDNGLIFQFAHAAALIRHNDSTNGDLFVVSKAYRALTDTILDNYDDITDSFMNLCSGAIVKDQIIPPGCALLAVEFYGGDDRHVSDYYYQPATIAFTNNIYLSYAMKNILTNPPTRLVQLYYDCVLSPVDSFFTSTGLAF